jgi:GT2 family glycosyltransferase
MVMPKVSIVTPSFNQARYLPQTLQCFREQDCPHIEHIVVDGGSTDGTPDILRAVPEASAALLLSFGLAALAVGIRCRQANGLALGDSLQQFKL